MWGRMARVTREYETTYNDPREWVLNDCVANNQFDGVQPRQVSKLLLLFANILKQETLASEQHISSKKAYDKLYRICFFQTCIAVKKMAILTHIIFARKCLWAHFCITGIMTK